MGRPSSGRAFMNEPHLEDCELTVAEKIKAVSAKLGEKISLRRFIR